MKNYKNGKIDIIIPAYNAQGTILRTISSIACQSIVDDLNVVIVNDCCPNGDYSEFVKMFEPFMSIQEIKMQENGGPGLARQFGIDHTENQYFTCIDADDTFAGAFALETMKKGINLDQKIQCCVGTFVQMGENLEMIPHQNDMVWMFGKIYKREFIDRYKIRFNDTRANEDTGFNTIVRILCTNNPNEIVHWIGETVYYWHEKKDSITRINDCQYSFDQSFCGWTDNMIYSIDMARRVQPFNGYIDQHTLECMMQLYSYYIETVARNPVFADQNWEYVKKFYHKAYKRIEQNVTPDMLAFAYSSVMQGKHAQGTMIGIIPCMGINEFMEKLKNEPYDENHIFDVWKKLPQELISNNEKCGVCKVGYTKKG